mmetsp:Transcript_4019/g.4646  ORF Transcript_4019/g.4646 Transcript_4019/m.4646 type:complete len:191 (+) Transcript_4019:28-600(+)
MVARQPLAFVYLLAAVGSALAKERPQKCTYDHRPVGPVPPTRHATLTSFTSGELHFEQECDNVRNGLIDLTHLAVTPLVIGEIHTVSVDSMGCSWGGGARFMEVWVDWERTGGFRRIVDSAAVWALPMGRNFTFEFFVPPRARPGASRLRLAMHAQMLQQPRLQTPPMDPCFTGYSGTLLDIAVDIQRGA